MRSLLALIVCLTAVPAAASTRVALTYFEVNSVRPAYQPLGRAVTDMLISDLSSARGLVLVERTRLNDVLTELEFQRSDALDADSAVAVGMVLGAEVIVLGSLTETADALRIDARAIDVASAQVLTTASVEGSADQFFRLESRLARDLARALADADIRDRYDDEAPPLNAAVSYGEAIDALDDGRPEEAAVAAARASRQGRGFRLADALAMETESLRPIGLGLAMDSTLRPGEAVFGATASAFVWPHRRVGAFVDIGIPWQQETRDQQWILLPARLGVQVRVFEDRSWNKRVMFSVGGTAVLDPTRVGTATPTGEERSTLLSTGWEVNAGAELHLLEMFASGGFVIRFRAGRQTYPWMNRTAPDELRFMGATFGYVFYPNKKQR